MNKIIKKVILKLINKLDFRIAENHNPLFACAYPKSGISYLSLFINLLLEDGFKINQFLLNENMREFVDYDRHLRSGVIGIDETIKIKIYKTHKEYKKYMKNIICLTRNPRTTIPSYYRFLKERNKLINVSFEDFAIGRYREINKWGDFYRSYLYSDESASFAMIRYEDIKSDENYIVRVLNDVFGIYPSKSVNEINQFDQLSFKGSKKYEERLNNFDLRISFSNKFKFSDHKLAKPVWTESCEKELQKKNEDILGLFNYKNSEHNI